MKKLLRALFGGGTSATPAAAQPIAPPARQPAPAAQPTKGRADYLLETIRHCPHLTPDIHEATWDHLQAVLEVSDNAGQLPLKDVRAKIKALDEAFGGTLAAHLTESGKALAHPVSVLEQIRTAASLRQGRGEKLAKMRTNPVVKMVSLMCSNSGDCEWCTATDGVEFEKQTDLQALIDANCTCAPHCRCAVQPILDL